MGNSYLICATESEKSGVKEAICPKFPNLSDLAELQHIRSSPIRVSTQNVSCPRMIEYEQESSDMNAE